MNFVCDVCESDKDGKRQIPSPNGQKCVYPIDNCADEDDEYQEFNGTWECSECLSGRFWNRSKKACQQCSEIDDLCTICSSEDGVGVCDQCVGGSMPDVEKDKCIPRIKNCASAPLPSQPEGLAITPPVIVNNVLTVQSTYYCDDCYEGFFWDQDSSTCAQCSIFQCVDCSSDNQCLRCNTGLMVSPDGRSCIPKIKDPKCAVPFNQQPKGLTQVEN
jgi:hypothetical protein